MPSALELIGLLLREGSPTLIQYAKEYMNGDELEKTQAIQKESFAKMHAVLQEGPAPTTEHGKDCPTCKIDPLKSVVGNRTWLLLHSTATAYPERPSPEVRQRVRAFVEGIFQNLPCRDCSDHMVAYNREHPVDYSSRKTLERSICQRHNLVREHLKQPITHVCK